MEEHRPEDRGPRGEDNLVALDDLVITDDVKVTKLLGFKGFEQIQSNFGGLSDHVLLLFQTHVDVLHLPPEGDDGQNLQFVLVQNALADNLLVGIHLGKSVARVWVDLVVTEGVFVGVLYPEDKVTFDLQLEGVVVSEEERHEASLLLVPAVRVEVDAQLKAIDHKLTRLQLLAELESLHFRFKILDGPAVREGHVWLLRCAAPANLTDCALASSHSDKTEIMSSHLTVYVWTERKSDWLSADLIPFGLCPISTVLPGR